MPKCGKYHAKWKANMGKCSKYHAKCNSPCRNEVLVPNCCKYKANGTRKERKKNDPIKSKKLSCNILHPFNFTVPYSTVPVFHVFHTDCIAVVAQALTIHDSSWFHDHPELSHDLRAAILSPSLKLTEAFALPLLALSSAFMPSARGCLSFNSCLEWVPTWPCRVFMIGWSKRSNLKVMNNQTLNKLPKKQPAWILSSFALSMHAAILLDVFRPGWARPTKTSLPTRPLRHPCTYQAWASWAGDLKSALFFELSSISLSISLSLSFS